MGLFAWTLNQMLTPKFWTLVKRQGFFQAYIKNHRTSRSSHYAGGTFGPLKAVGQDEFGNRYYEDFDVYQRNQRRWVEYSDYFMGLGITSDRIPPGWQGWLCLQYDDFPTRTNNQRFYSPFYQKPHTEITSGTANHHMPQGVNENPNRPKFIEEQRDRRAQPWDPEDANQFDGKRLIKTKTSSFEDVMATKE